MTCKEIVAVINSKALFTQPEERVLWEDVFLPNSFCGRDERILSKGFESDELKTALKYKLEVSKNMI